MWDFPFLSQVRGLIEKKHEHLLAVVHRHFAARRFCLHLLKEMRLSRLKTQSQTDFRSALMEDPTKSHSCLGSTLKVRTRYYFIETSSQTHQRKNKSWRAPLKHSPSCGSSPQFAHVCSTEQQRQPGGKTPGSRESAGGPQLPAGVSVRAGNRDGASASARAAGAGQRPQPRHPGRNGGPAHWSTDHSETRRRGQGEVGVTLAPHYRHCSDNCVSSNAGVSNSNTQYRQHFKLGKKSRHLCFIAENLPLHMKVYIFIWT